MSHHDVIIVGGGPVGMGLAIELGQRGLAVALVERRLEPQRIPKGQNLTQRSLENIDAWGCEPELRAARVVPRGVANGGVVTYGTYLSEFAYDWFPREKVGAYYGQTLDRLPQYETERVLRDRVAAIDTIETYYGWEFAGVTEGDGAVRIDVTECDGDGRLSLHGTYAVACDGSRSALRDAAAIPQTVSDHDRRMALLVFKSTELHELLGERHEPKAFYNALDPEFEGYWLFLGRVDLGSEWFFHAPVPDGEFDAEALLHKAVGRPFELELTYSGRWDLRFAMADTYRSGRVFVAGDAAHSHPPYGGYGINTGFEDARNLGWKLAAMVNGWGGNKLLGTYDTERRPVFASTARDFIARFIIEDRAFLAEHGPGADPEGFAKLWASRPDASEIVAFEPHYEGSAIVAGQGEPSARGTHSFQARPGHHLAPRALSDGRNTYDALGPDFTLFLFGLPDLALPAFEDIPVDVVADTYDGERRDYDARAILVRPDGFVAWASADGDGLQAALRMAAGH